MRIVCEKCSAEHALEPPEWVVSSGKPFRFRCASCGHTQMVPPPTNIALPSDVLPPGSNSDTAVPAGSRGETVAPPPARPEGSLYLKQEGKVYLVRDWDTLGRWIEESRVGPEDLVSEGGVRWEPISARPELSGLFVSEVSDKTPINPEPPPIAAPTPFSFGGETPFGTPEQAPPRSGLASARDVDGIPVGLPPMPAIELTRTGATASEASAAPTDGAEITADPDDAEITDEPDTDHAVTDVFADIPTQEGPQDDEVWDGSRPSRTPMIVAIIATILIVIAVVALLLRRPPAPPPEGPDLGSVIANPEPEPEPLEPEPLEPEPLEPEPADSPPEVEPAPEPAPAPEPTVAVVPAPQPEPPAPAPEPEPEPAPEPPPARDPSALVDAGWQRVEEGDQGAALESFRAALSQAPGDPEASFGLGYVLAAVGRPEEARPHLCRAFTDADIETQREAEAILTENALVCD